MIKKQPKKQRKFNVKYLNEKTNEIEEKEIYLKYSASLPLVLLSFILQFEGWFINIESSFNSNQIRYLIQFIDELNFHLNLFSNISSLVCFFFFFF